MRILGLSGFDIAAIVISIILIVGVAIARKKYKDKKDYYED